MNISGISYPDVNNGLGCRVTLWVSGCSHHCKGCQNKETWDKKSGRVFSKEDKDKLFEILSKPYIKGLTLSGGDPLDSFDEVLQLVEEIRDTFGSTKDIWLYTGYTLNQIKNSEKKEILPYINYLVDGLFELDKRDITLKFRGSTNQIIWENKDGKFEKSELKEKARKQ